MIFDVFEITAAMSLVVMPVWHQSPGRTLLYWIINKYTYKKQQNKSHRLKQNRTPLRFCFASRKIEVSKGFPPVGSVLRPWKFSNHHIHTVPYSRHEGALHFTALVCGRDQTGAGSAHNQIGRESAVN
jgi:hypothetical protein